MKIYVGRGKAIPNFINFALRYIHSAGESSGQLR